MASDWTFSPKRGTLFADTKNSRFGRDKFGKWWWHATTRLFSVSVYTIGNGTRQRVKWRKHSSENSEMTLGSKRSRRSSKLLNSTNSTARSAKRRTKLWARPCKKSQSISFSVGGGRLPESVSALSCLQRLSKSWEFILSSENLGAWFYTWMRQRLTWAFLEISYSCRKLLASFERRD